MRTPVAILFCLLTTFGAVAQSHDLSVCEAFPDGRQEECRAFYRALSGKQLLSPADSSAYRLYQSLSKEPLLAADTLRVHLVRALFGEATRGLGRIIRAQMDPVWESLVVQDSCRRYAAYFEKLVTLLEEGHPQASNLLAQQWYLEGLDLRLQAQRTVPPDTILLRRAARHQLTGLDLDYRSANISNELGVIFYALRDYPQSSVFFLQAAEKDSTWSAPLIGLSRCLAQAGEPRKALQLAGEALQLEPGFPFTYLNLAHLIADAGEPQLSFNAVEKAVEALAARPVDNYSRLAMAGLLMEFDLYERAEPLLLKVLEQQSVLPVYLRLASLYDRTGRLPAADSLYRVCIDRWPDDPEAYLQLGLIYHGLGRYPIARQYYEAALERVPGHPEVCYNLGLLYELSRQEAEAEELFLRALAYPVQLEGMFDFLDSVAATVSAGTQIIFQLPEPDGYFRNTPPFAGLDRPVSRFEDLIYLSLGDHYYRKEQFASAIPMYENAVLLNPGQAAAYVRLIESCLRQGAYQRAHLFAQLYTVYITPSRENQTERKLIRDMAKQARKAGARRVPLYRLDYYFYVLDGLWPYLYGLREPALELDPASRKAGQKSVPRLLREWEG